MKNILIKSIFVIFVSLLFCASLFIGDSKADIANDTDKAIEGGVKTLNKLKERAESENSEETNENGAGVKAAEENTDFPIEFDDNRLKNLENEFSRPIYTTRGKRDPFKPFIQAPKETTKVPISDSTPPIKRYALNQYRIVGVVWFENSPKAMVVDPEQNTYYLGIDDEIGNKNGKIVEVRDNGLLVQEKRFFEDVFGNSKVEVIKSVLAFIEEE
ncbi:MAG: pilus assembly protein PilP [Thermodesulfobacteriota bacterium]